jgi:hypothetical protein
MPQLYSVGDRQIQYEFGAVVGKYWQGKMKVLRETTCPSITLCTTKPRQTGLGSNLGLCGDRSGTNCPSHTTTTSRCNISVWLYGRWLIQFTNTKIWYKFCFVVDKGNAKTKSK